MGSMGGGEIVKVTPPGGCSANAETDSNTDAGTQITDAGTQNADAGTQKQTHASHVGECKRLPWIGLSV